MIASDACPSYARTPAICFLGRAKEIASDEEVYGWYAAKDFYNIIINKVVYVLNVLCFLRIFLKTAKFCHKDIKR